MTYDLFVIGGGINGTGIARDAAGRGLRVGLCERDDLAAHTSSASTKLIHGGLRYLESYAFRLVRESLLERETLLAAAPHIIWPMRFVLPHHTGLRPAWLLRLGLLLYDHLGGRRTLPPTRAVRLDAPPFAGQLQARYRRGFEYSDCWVEDARLVVLNAVDARERGADVLTRTECIDLERGSDRWHIRLRRHDGGTTRVEARVLVNAAGPWVDAVEDAASGGRARRATRLVKGSHVVVPRLFPGEHAFIFQAGDGRVMFAIPYEGEFTLLGTTDVAVATPAAEATVCAEEVAYLCETASGYFARPVRPADVVWRYAGVRPLFDDAAENASRVTRDYRLTVDADAGATRLTVYGGKLTTYRRLAEQALEKLGPHLPARTGGPWTAGAPLPGGDVPGGDLAALRASLAARHPWLAPATLRRLVRAYGTRAERLLAAARGPDDLGRHFGQGLYERELRYLVEAEFAGDAQDVLWRRSKLGLHMTGEEREAVGAWFAQSAPRQTGGSAGAP